MNILSENKKGMESTTVIIGIVLALVVFGIIGVVYYNYLYKPSEGNTGVIPEALVSKANLCKNLGNQQTAYCSFGDNTINVPGQGDSYINCEYSGNADFRAEIDNAIANPPECETSEEEFCIALRKTEGFKGAYVNGIECKGLKDDGVKCVAGEVAGQADWYSECGEGYDDGTIFVTNKEDFNAHKGSLCCIKD